MKALSRMAPLLSGGAVAMGLVFVGFELKQNTAMMQGTTMQAISDTYVEYVTGIAHDPVAADLMNRLHNGEITADFGGTENTQISVLFNAFVQLLENSFLQHRAGLVPDAVFDSYGWKWGMIQTPRFEEYWTDAAERVVSPEFAEFFGRTVQIGPGEA